MLLEQFFDITGSLGVIIAAIAALYGINTWRRETRWKREYELALKVLSAVYKAETELRIIRSPVGFTSEGKNRPKRENENPKESQILDINYATQERFLNYGDGLGQLRELKFEFMSIHGEEYSDAFDAFSRAISRVLAASAIIAQIKLERFEDDNSDILKENRTILYGSLTTTEDPIDKLIQPAKEKLEKKCREIILNKGKIKSIRLFGMKLYISNSF